MHSPYDIGFYDEQERSSRDSASVVVEIAMSMVSPTSVLDLGCGLGHWLAEFQRLGVEDVIGVDGAHVELDRLRIPTERFHPHNLEEPLPFDRSFDLAMSVEVAEHLDASAADGFVESLTAAAPVVLFSAAIPGQGGTNHINCQWPTYWIEKFAALQYVLFDLIRPAVWDDDRVDWTYAQNTLLFARSDAVERLGLSTIETRPIVSLVHPRHLEVVLATNVSRYSPKSLARALPTSLGSSFGRRIRNIVSSKR